MISIKPAILLFLGFWMTSVPLYSRNTIVFRHIDSQNGLSDNQVRTIMTAPDGRIIVRTVSMVNFYDATTFRHNRYNSSNTYKWDYKGFESDYLDHDQRIWMKDAGQLLLFDLKTNMFVYDVGHILSSYGIKEPLKDVFLDKDKNYWFLTERFNLYYCQWKKQTSKRLTAILQPDNAVGEVLAIEQVKSIVYVLFRDGSLRLFHVGKGQFIKKETYLSSRMSANLSRYMMKSDAKGNLWVMLNGTNGGLFMFSTATGRWEEKLPAGDFYTSFDLAPDGRVWVGSRNCLYILDNKHEPIVLNKFELDTGGDLSNDINSVFADPNGGIWLGLFNQGLLYYHPNILKFSHYNRGTNDNGVMLENGVRCLLEDNGNTILIGTVKGLLRFNPKTETLSLVHPSLRNTFCLHMVHDAKGRLWIASLNEGLYCLDKTTLRNYHQGQQADGLTDNNVRTFFEDNDGSCYVCTESGGLGRFDPVSGRFFAMKEQYPALKRFRILTHIVRYQKDQLLVASQNGLFLYRPKSGELLIPPLGNKEADRIFLHSNNKYNCIYTDSRQYIWFGTQDGLNIWCPDIQQQFTFYMEQGLANNCIQAIIEDMRGDVWISTSNGVTRVSIQKKKGMPEFSFINFNQLDGLAEGELYERSALVASDGSLYFGGVNGFNKINPKNINFGSGYTHPVFVRMKLFNKDITDNGMFRKHKILTKPLTETDQIVLAHNENFISLDFSALNFINPTQTYYRYMLEGLDEEWTDIHAPDGTGRVTYTGLRPGYYTLKVYAADNSKDWDQMYSELRIRVKSPFWATPLAWLVYMLLVASGIYWLILWRVRKNQRIMQQKQEEESRLEKAKLDQMKFLFFTNISHEFRTPLSLIITPLDTLIKRTTDEAVRKLLLTISKSANDLLKLVNQLLDFRRVEMKGEHLNVSYNDVMEFIDNLYDAFRETATEKKIALNIEHHKACLYMFFDKDKLLRIMNNLLSNAFKFTPEGGKVAIRISEETLQYQQPARHRLKIDVEDNGVGIPESEIDHIFNRFYQADNHIESTAGSGIGLHLVREYVLLHQGTIQVKSKPGKGSVFTVYLPMDLKSEESQPEQVLSKEDVPVPASQALSSEGHRLKLMIVEDNSEFRAFLSDSLSDTYQVEKAADGLAGLHNILKTMPDLIISDVMMPQMNGIELCRKIKTDIRISHIPVILLTAKVSEQFQLDGYEAGADAYVAKPFNLEMLQLRIRKLIEQQENRKQLFRKTIDVSPSSITITSLDEKLVQKALNCVEKNMDNLDYSVEELSNDIGMNRAHLYRKLQSIVGMTPTEFIRSIRLKRAAQLLEKSQLTVAEIADMVGFNTPKYFSKYFKDMFGVYPSQYARKTEE